MKKLWYWEIIGEKFAPAICTLQDLKALPDRDRRIRFYVQSLALRLIPLLDELLAGSAKLGTDDLAKVRAQFEIIRGKEGKPQRIDEYPAKKDLIIPSEAFAEIIQTARQKFNSPETVLRCLRCRRMDELDALVEVIKKEKARAKSKNKRTRLDELLGGNADNTVAVAKIVKTAMGRITSEKEVLEYLRSANGDKPVGFVEVMHESRPNPLDPTVERNGLHSEEDSPSDRPHGMQLFHLEHRPKRLCAFRYCKTPWALPGAGHPTEQRGRSAVMARPQR